MRKIALVNQKGGCGKTTTAINLASCLSGEGRNVLLIDLDPQGHSGLGLGATPDQIENSIYEVLLGKIPISEAIQCLRKNLDAIFSNVVLSAFEQVMAGAHEREYKLEQSLADIADNYDYLIIDSPPSVGLLTFNGLVVSEEVIIPVDPSSFSLHGLDKLLDTIKIIEEKTEHQLFIKILASNIDRRTRFGRHVVEELKAHFPENCFETVINTCTRLREAASQGQPIAEYDKRCAAFRDYQRLTEEVLDDEIEMKVKMPDLKPLWEAEYLPGQLLEKEIAFTIEAPAGASVQIAGDFNDWAPEGLELTESQGRRVWHKVVSLPPGSHQYKYLIDGRWMLDPDNDQKVDDLFGGANSVIKV
jgi:chromosome partitioning protein